MVTLHKKHELTEDILNEEELQIKVFEEYKSLEKRNYKKEFQNLHWSKIKEKMGGEECKIDNDCISNIPRYQTRVGVIYVVLKNGKRALSSA